MRTVRTSTYTVRLTKFPWTMERTPLLVLRSVEMESRDQLELSFARTGAKWQT